MNLKVWLNWVCLCRRFSSSEFFFPRIFLLSVRTLRIFLLGIHFLRKKRTSRYHTSPFSTEIPIRLDSFGSRLEQIEFPKNWLYLSTLSFRQPVFPFCDPVFWSPRFF